MNSGAAYNIKPFGLYAAESMRLEKGYRHWKSDLLIEFSPFESGLDMFVKMEKGDFIGKEALSQRDVNWQFITMRIDAITQRLMAVILFLQVMIKLALLPHQVMARAQIHNRLWLCQSRCRPLDLQVGDFATKISSALAK